VRVTFNLLDFLRLCFSCTLQHVASELLALKASTGVTGVRLQPCPDDHDDNDEEQAPFVDPIRLRVADAAADEPSQTNAL